MRRRRSHMLRTLIYPSNSSAPENPLGIRRPNPKTIFLFFSVLVFISGFCIPAAFGQGDALLGESAWNLGITLSLSDNAALAAAELVDGVNSTYGTSLTPLPLARVDFRDTHVLRDQLGLVIGNGQRLSVTLSLIVEDPQSLTGYTALLLSVFQNSPENIQYSIDQGWLTAPPDTTAEALLSEVIRKYSITRRLNFTVEGPDGPQELAGVDTVCCRMRAQGPPGFASVQACYLRRNTLEYTEIIPELELGCWFDLVIGLRMMTDPTQLYDFYKRSTTWIVPEEDRKSLVLEFELEDELLSRIFDDPENTVSGCEEEFRDSFFEPTWMPG
jgi:hypothetical protein